MARARGEQKLKVVLVAFAVAIAMEHFFPSDSKASEPVGPHAVRQEPGQGGEAQPAQAPKTHAEAAPHQEGADVLGREALAAVETDEPEALGREALKVVEDEERRRAPPARAPALASAKKVTASLAAILDLMSKPPAQANSARETAPVSVERALYQLSVNSVDAGVVEVFRRDGDMFVPLASLARAGVRDASVRKADCGGVPCVSLSSAQLSYTADDRDLVLRVRADPSLFGSNTIDLGRAPPVAERLDVRPSAFFNYGAQVDQDRNATGFGELGGSAFGATAVTSFSATSGGLSRGVSSISYDQPSALRRFIGGDQVAGGQGFFDGGLGGTLSIAGASVSREFSLDPSFDRAARPQLSAQVETPSRMDVYVNGQLVRSQEVGPGTVSVQNLPTTEGGGTATYVLHDAFGRTQTIASPFYFASTVLSKGLTDYSYAAGFRRTGVTDNAYGAPAFLGRHRVGITDSITVGGRADASHGMISGGPGATLALPFGTAEVDAAVSRDQGLPGFAASASWSYVGRLAHVSARVMTMSRSYANASLSSRDDRAMLRATASAGMSVTARLGFGVAYDGSISRDALPAHTPSVNASYAFTDRASAYVQAGWAAQQGVRPQPQVLATLVFTLGGRVSSDTVGQSQPGLSSVATHLQRSIEPGTGYGYRVGADSVAGPDVQLEAQNGFGHAQLNYQRTVGTTLATAQVAGALVAINGEMFATRPVRQGYALIEVPGAANVRGFLDNQEIGRTNDRGELFVPDVLPYYDHKFSIELADLPLTTSAPSTQKHLTPGQRAGTVARFDLRKMRSVAGTLYIEQGPEMHRVHYGDFVVVLETREITSPVDDVGRFYLEDLPPGRYPARIVEGRVTCTFRIEVPDMGEAVIEMGEVRCQQPYLAIAKAETAP